LEIRRYNLKTPFIKYRTEKRHFAILYCEPGPIINIMRITRSIFMTLKLSLVIILMFLLYSPVYGQKKNDWYSFADKNTHLTGYKDKRGNIKIPAKFGGLTSALVFRDVIAVYEDKSGKSYYLLKNGKKFGTDSLYVYDNSYDDLHEGKIRFRDKKTDKVGFFNKNGAIVIPAKYNDARPFYNGLALVVHNGKRVCMDGGAFNPAKPCEDWSWDGITAIIDIHNKILADDIKYEETENIDWNSFKITNSLPDTTIFTGFKTPDNKFCTFLNFEKEFTKWFYKNYLSNINIEIFSANCYKEVMVENRFESMKGKLYTKSSFKKYYQTIVMKEMESIKLNKVETEIFDEELNPYDFNDKNFSIFYANDGEPDKQKYPVFNVICTYTQYNKKLDYQQQFFFIRTTKGYKLYQIALNVGRQKQY
jgi:hypothetical protein